MEKSLYAKIMRDTVCSRDIHNELIKSISHTREILENEADYLVEAGRATSPKSTEECKKKRFSLYDLKKMDDYMETKLPKKYNPFPFVKALCN